MKALLIFVVSEISEIGMEIIDLLCILAIDFVGVVFCSNKKQKRCSSSYKHHQQTSTIGESTT